MILLAFFQLTWRLDYWLINYIYYIFAIFCVFLTLLSHLTKSLQPDTEIMQNSTSCICKPVYLRCVTVHNNFKQNVIVCMDLFKIKLFMLTRFKIGNWHHMFLKPQSSLGYVWGEQSQQILCPAAYRCGDIAKDESKMLKMYLSSSIFHVIGNWWFLMQILCKPYSYSFTYNSSYRTYIVYFATAYS